MVREPDATMEPAPQDIQLMSKRRVLSLKPQLRLEWRGQDGQNETEQPDHSASLGDSIASSTRIRFSVHTTGKIGEITRLADDHARHPNDGRAAQHGCCSREKTRHKLVQGTIEDFGRASDGFHIWDHRRANHRAEQLLFGRKVEVDRTFDDACLARDVVEFGRSEAVIGKDVQGRGRDFGGPCIPSPPALGKTIIPGRPTTDQVICQALRGWLPRAGNEFITAAVISPVQRRKLNMLRLSKPWTPEEDERIRSLAAEGASAMRASVALKRNMHSVFGRARKLGCPFQTIRAAREKLANTPNNLWRGSRSSG
jgi:hypothetical protein